MSGVWWKILMDPATGQRFTWVGAGKTEDVPEAVLAYSVSGNGGVVALADGSVQQVSSDKLEEMLRQDGLRTANSPGMPALAAAAVLVRLTERLENILLPIFRDADTRVGDGEQ